jgi:hypothetical protein
LLRTATEIALGQRPERSLISENERRRRGYFCIFLAAVFCVIILLSKYNQLTFPYPWNDEARFFLPSWQFSINGSLKPVIVNARDGIFWVPHGYYVLFGALLRLFGRTIEVARSITQVFVASAVVLAVLNNQRISRSYTIAICTAAVLVSPPVILSANEVRMECVMALLYSLSVLLALRARELATLSCLLLSTLFHPALTIALLLYSISIFARFRFVRTPATDGQRKVLDYVCFAVVVGAVLLEAVFVARHYSLFREHMLYQTNRKLGRSLVQLLKRPQAIILDAESVIVLCSLLLVGLKRISKRAFYCELLPVMSIAFGLSLYGTLGAEFQYDIYCLSFVPATFISVAYRLSQLVGVNTEAY